jgi:hypothetical protein
MSVSVEVKENTGRSVSDTAETLAENKRLELETTLYL